MQRAQQAALRWSVRLTDALALIVTFFVVARAREFLRDLWTLDIVPGQPLLQKVTLQNQLHLIFQMLPIWMLALHVTGAYADLRRTRRDVLLIRLATGVCLAVLMLTSVQFVFTPEIPTSRSFVLGYAAVSTVMLFLARLIRLPQEATYNIVVVGSAQEVIPFLKILERHRDWGLRVAGVVRPDSETLSPIDDVPVLGTVSDLQQILTRSTISQVFMTGRAWDTRTLRTVADVCEEVGVTFSMDANFLGFSIARADLQDFEGWGVLSFSSTPRNGDALLVKRAMDVVGSLVVLGALLPVLAAVAALIKLEDGGPSFFTQQRSGVFGRTFPMYKFRSMVVDAEAKKAALEKFNEMSGPVFKMENDPRITRIGRFIRKTSLDEFPQFWNVLRGEMSLVGPRPPIPAEVERYERWQMRRLSMKPGITCIWQVSGRNNIDFDTWMRLDLEYIDKWSLFMDIKLLLRTIPVVLLGRGAK